MAFTITKVNTNNITQITDDGSIWSVYYTKTNKQHNSLMFYIDYTQGDETEIVIRVKRMDQRLSTEYFYETIASGTGEISIYEQTITSSGRYVIHWQIAKSEEFAIIEVEPDATTGDGTVLIEISENNFST